MKSLHGFVLDGSKDPMKQTNAHETKLKQALNAVKLGLKPTQRNKRNITKKKNKRGGHLER